MNSEAKARRISLNEPGYSMITESRRNQMAFAASVAATTSGIAGGSGPI